MRDVFFKEKVLYILFEIVLMNEEMVREMEVWFVFMVYVRYKKDMFDVNYDGIYSGMWNLIVYLDEFDLLR